MKEKPKAKQTGEPKAERAETTRGAQTAQGANPSARDTANPSAANGAAQGAAAGVIEQKAVFYAQKYIRDLRVDCDILKFEIKSALYDNGAGLLENEKIRVPLGRIAAIESWIKYFTFTEEMISAMRDEVTANGRGLVRETELLRERLTGKAERIETFADVRLSEIKQWYQILFPDSWEIEFFNLSQMAFEEWFNFHVVPVLSLLKKWVEVAEDLPKILLDADAVENCKCHYIPANPDNGGIAELCFNFNWIDDFLTVARLRDGKPKHGEPVARPNPSARDTANPSEPVGNGAAVFNITAAAVNVQAATVEMPKPKKQNAGNCGGMSQAKFAALLKHYGGKKHGEEYTARTVKVWERGKTEAPTAGGVKYCAELRRDILKARTWAYNFNRENENAYNARKTRV